MISFLLILLSLFAAEPITAALTASFSNPTIHHVQIEPLSHRNNHHNPIAASLLSVDRTLQKYGLGGLNYSIAQLLEKRSMVTQSLEHVEIEEALGDGQVVYASNITFGRQTFFAIWDTGTATSWVPGLGCDGCHGFAEYDMKGHLADGQERTQHYYTHDGRLETLEGYLYVDKVSIGSLSANDVEFVAVRRARVPSYVQAEAALGFPASATKNGETLMYQLLLQSQLSEASFAFFFGGQWGQSQVAIGGVNNSLLSGPFTTVPIARKGEWSVDVDALYLGGREVLCTGGLAYIDTSIAEVLVTSEVFRDLVAQIPGGAHFPMSRDGSQLVFPCGQRPTYTISFKIGGKELEMSYKDFVAWQVPSQSGETTNFVENLVGKSGDAKVARKIKEAMKNGADICGANVWGVPSLANGVTYALGTSFLSNWYTKFTYGSEPTVGFASLSSLALDMKTKKKKKISNVVPEECSRWSKLKGKLKEFKNKCLPSQNQA